MGYTKTVAVYVVLLAIISSTAALPEYHKVRTYYASGVYADEDIMLDEGEKYAVITVSKINGEGIPTINLHDFVSGYSAIKDVANKTCYIQRSTHTMEGMKDETYQAVKNNGENKISQRFDCIKQETIVKSWLPMYGRRISAFCENYDSRFFEPKDVKLTKRSTKIVSQNALWCIFCLYDGCWQ